MSSIAPVKKILILASNPKRTSLLDLDREIRDIREGLQRSRSRDQFVLETRGAVRPEDLRRAMLEVKPQIVHFCGHGTGNQGLVLEDNEGNEYLASTEALSDLFRIFALQVECVLLNAYYSEVQADAIVEHIKYVIGMNREVRDDAAIEFTVGFYDTLGAGESIEQAFNIGRNAVQFKILDRGVHQEHLIPVLKKNPNLNDSSNPSTIESVAEASIPPILLKSIEFLFGEASNILEDLQERHKAAQPTEMDERESISGLTINSEKREVISSKAAALSHSVIENVLSNLEPRIKHLLSLLEIHKRNYYLAKEQYARHGGAAYVPPIVVNNLSEAENQIVKNAKELQVILSKVYGKQVNIPKI